ncbi:hypothetical protein FKP32DRAFT_1085663 [Trametes sanguinea]|nr:hypothetical protein FKP32DRAFT_1085663 [Trametes sanguinea]
MDYDDLEAYVRTAAFDAECINYARTGGRHRARSSSSGASDIEWKIDYVGSNDSNALNAEHSEYDAPPYEAHLYYAGLSGPSGRGPKLVYRTSKDRFAPPMGPEAYRRLMKLVGVPAGHALGERRDGRLVWDVVREEVVEILDKRRIQLTSVDLVRFRWTVPDDDQQDVESEDDSEGEVEEDASYADIAPIDPVVDGTVYTTPATIWVGVKPDSLTGEQAHSAAMEILDLLIGHRVTDIEVAFRESEVQFCAGPQLFAPTADEDPLRGIVDSLSTTVGLPIAGMKTKMQGTLGFYFRAGDDLYAVAARHVLFKADDPNVEYNHVAGRRKDVMVMRPSTFTSYLALVQGTIGNLLETAEYLSGRAQALAAPAADDYSRSTMLQQDLHGVEHQLVATREQINVLKAHFVKLKKEWSKPKDRVIGYAVWSPPLGAAMPPHSYTRDICVIKLDKDKFRHLRGNFLSLGPTISRVDFRKLTNAPVNRPPEVSYPENGLLTVREILPPEQMRPASSSPPEQDHVLPVLKRGAGSLTTAGGLSGFSSHLRRYFITGHIDSVEVAVFPHSHDSGPFSRRGDSGSAIVDVKGRLVAQLNGAAGRSDSSDIAYGTPMHYLWPVIQAKFPGATLCWDDEDVVAEL